MSRVDLWTKAADAMRQDADPRWHAVADWLRSEALVQDGMEPFVDLLDAIYEQKSGIKGYLRLARKPDGEVVLNADTNEGATAVALAYLDPPRRPPGRPAPDTRTDRGELT